jgi:uncharacterized protein YecE (DUF72 family)
MKAPPSATDVSAAKKQAQRARRMERRLKQREANPERAATMHRARMQKKGSAPAAPVKPTSGEFVGCSGCFYWKWKGPFYPSDLPTSQWFAYYAARFDTVEINASFYSWPTVATVKGWLRQSANEDFVYTVKVCELITHVKKFRGTKVLIRDFGFIADVLGDRMGCFLFQVPPSFLYTKARLVSIVGQLDPARRNVVEFRHASWWNETVYAAFREAGIIFCSCSAPNLPEALVRTADDVYLRLHGPERWYRHDYVCDELNEWATRLRACGAKRAWVYFNNDYGGFAPKNAQSIQDMWTDDGSDC